LADEQNIDDRQLLLRHGGALLAAAAQAIEFALKHGRAPKISVDDVPRELQQHRATFVTLTLNNRLRGCVGTLSPRQPLIADTAANGYAAAFHDPRFPALMPSENERINLSVTLLGPETELSFTDEAALLGKRAVFLPQVWKNLSDPADFLVELKLKAGWTRDHWSPTLKAWRFSALTVRRGKEDASSIEVTEDIDEE
jgi:AmmeMemoRadiSam system protein A